MDALTQIEAEQLAVGLEQDLERQAALQTALSRSRDQIARYARLDGTLTALASAPRHRVMAPVCGGLGYFEAELVDVNSVLVLLGNSIFAERSLPQTKDISKRRVEYLKREEQTLAQEMEVVAQRLAAAREFGVISKDGSPQPSVMAGGGVRAMPQTDVGRGAGDDEAEEGDEESSEVDEDDLLTSVEIEAIEEQLGEDVMDDEKAEAALKAATVAKRAARLAREAAARAASQAFTEDPAPASSASASASPTAPVFRDPSDIGRPAQPAAKPAVSFREPVGEPKQTSAPTRIQADSGSDGRAQKRATVEVGSIKERPSQGLAPMGGGARPAGLKPMGSTGGSSAAGGGSQFRRNRGSDGA
jgi:prefoldin subunit 5